MLVLDAGVNHPRLQGRVRVPIIIAPRGSIPEGYILPEGAPLPSSCDAIGVLLKKENGAWKIDNFADLAS